MRRNPRDDKKPPAMTKNPKDMKICIVSDSHDRAEPLAEALAEAQAAGAQAVIHCGD